MRRGGAHEQHVDALHLSNLHYVPFMRASLWEGGRKFALFLEDNPDSYTFMQTFLSITGSVIKMLNQRNRMREACNMLCQIVVTVGELAVATRLLTRWETTVSHHTHPGACKYSIGQDA